MEHRDDDRSEDNPQTDTEIKFTLGKGNQSAICGGVSSLKVVDPTADAKQQPKTTPTT
jgi:hypothetical protein